MSIKWCPFPYFEYLKFQYKPCIAYIPLSCQSNNTENTGYEYGLPLALHKLL